jgi:hypothetical protein
MVQFILDNKEWIFSGIGVAILGGLIAILSRGLQKSRAKPPQVIIHVSGTDQNNSEENKATEITPVSIKRISPIRFKDIKKAIDEAPPLQRDQVRKNFVGIKVEWDTYLKGATKQKDDMVHLGLRTEENFGLDTIWCMVPLSQYRELGVLPEGTRIRIQGEIEDADSWDVTLKNVTLFFYGD